MEVFENNIEINLKDNLYLDFDIKNAVFFDIETTGFAPKNTLLYLIGCIYYDNNSNNFKTKQWFMNEIVDEPLILAEFFNFISNFKYIVHYNGNGFDIPYIEKKCLLYNMSYDFSKLISIDIYKKILPYKKIFSLENIKQKSIEKFLGISRIDKYTGGELISVYYEYLKNKTSDYKEFLIRHNYDDLLGLIKILPILNYTCIFDKKLSISSIDIKLKDNIEKEAVIKCITTASVENRISFGNSTYYVTWENNILKLSIQIYSGGLKFFYPNYKDYYYLPKEDCSIHKSVAFYVDKNYRTKAKAANCYSKKTGRFIPQISEIIKPFFKIDYYDKITYFELTPEILEAPDCLMEYVYDTIKQVILAK